MWPFGKEKLSEIEAAALFIVSIFKDVQQYWPEISSELNDMFKLEKQISNDSFAGFEFALAVVTIQMQALNNLLKEDQAKRIKKHIHTFVSASEDVGEYSAKTIQLYQDAWNQCVSSNEMPFDGVVSILFDKLECQSAVELSGVRFKDPLLLMALTEKVVYFGGPWWKNLIAKYKLVP